MALETDYESESRKAGKEQNSLKFSYSIFAPTLSRMGYIRDFVDIEKSSKAQHELARTFNEHMYRQLAHVFESLNGYNVVVVPRAYSSEDEEALVKIISYLKGWESTEVKKLVSLIVERADMLRALGLHPLQVLHALESSVKIREEVKQSVAGSLGTEIPVHAKAEATYSKVERREIEATVTPDSVRMAVSAVLSTINRPTILVLSEKELEILGAETVLSSTVGNRNLVVLAWLPSSPSQEFVKLVTSDRVATTFMPILKGTLKSHIVNIYVEAAKHLMPGILQQQRRQLKKGLSSTISLLISTGVLQKVIDRYIDYLVDPLLIVDATNRYVSKMYGLMLLSPENLLNMYRNSDRSIQRTIERELYYLSELVAHEALAETLMKYGYDAHVSLAEMLLSISSPGAVLEHMLSIGKELQYPMHTDKAVEFMRKTGIIALKATREGTFRMMPGVKYLYDAVKTFVEVSAKRSQQSTVEASS